MDTRTIARSFADLAALVKQIPMPIYGYCLAREGRISASNGVTDVDIPMDLPAGDHGLLLPIQQISNLCRGMAKAGLDIHWEIVGDQIHVSHTFGDVWLKGRPAEEFPLTQVQEPITDPLAEFSVADLSQGLRVIDPVASRLAGGALPGALLEIYPNGFTLVALDGPRLASYSCGEPSDTCLWRGIIPRQTLVLLLRRCGDEGNVLFSASSVGARFSFGEEHVSTRLIDAPIPEWRRATIFRNEMAAKVDVSSCLDVLDVCAITKAPGEIFTVRLSFSKDALEFHSESETGNVTQTVPVKYRGGKQMLLLNGEFLKAALDALGSEEVEILHDGSPMRALSVTSMDGKSRHILMPMRGPKEDSDES